MLLFFLLQLFSDATIRTKHLIQTRDIRAAANENA